MYRLYQRLHGDPVVFFQLLTSRSFSTSGTLLVSSKDWSQICRDKNEKLMLTTQVEPEIWTHRQMHSNFNRWDHLLNSTGCMQTNSLCSVVQNNLHIQKKHSKHQLHGNFLLWSAQHEFYVNDERTNDGNEQCWDSCTCRLETVLVATLTAWLVS